MSDNKDYGLGEEEQDILEHFEWGELNSPTDAEREMELARQSARNTLANPAFRHHPHIPFR